MDYKKYIGTWVNTLTEGQEIVQFRLFEENGILMIAIETTNPVRAWGAARAYPFGLKSDAQKFAAFEARCDADDMEAHLFANESKGLLVVVSCLHVRAGAASVPYFAREFFYKI